jgi:VanZ family protein
MSPFFRKPPQRVLLWGGTLVYTLALPHLIYVYNWLSSALPGQTAGYIPFALIATIGLGLVSRIPRSPAPGRSAALLALVALLSVAVYALNPDPVQFIHLPEYAIMAWLVHAAVRRDCPALGSYALALLCASLLGALDEIQQGIHPGRYYGTIDILVNSLSALIGLVGLRALRLGAEVSDARFGGLDRLAGCLRAASPLVLSVGAGIGALAGLELLTTADSAAPFPVWLQCMNALGVVAAALCIPLVLLPRRGSCADPAVRTWVLPLAALLLTINALALAVLLLPLDFR